MTECRWCLGTDEVFDPPTEFLDLGANAGIYYLANPFAQEWFNCHHVQNSDDSRIAENERLVERMRQNPLRFTPRARWAK
jgi:hypothetical protein